MYLRAIFKIKIDEKWSNESERDLWKTSICQFSYLTSIQRTEGEIG
jgi:hypothetical protein